MDDNKEPIADLSAFTEGSVRDFPDFCEDLQRLSSADRRTAKAIRKEIYDTIDTRVRNAVKAALAAQAEQSQSAGSARQGGITSDDSSEKSAAAIASQSQAAQPTTAAVMLEAADVLAGQNWRGDLVEQLRDAAHIAGTSQATQQPSRKEIAQQFVDLARESQATKAQAEPSPIGKLLDEFSALPVLWGLNEPGALVRHSDVFKMLVAAGKTYLAAPVAKEAPPNYQIAPVGIAADLIASIVDRDTPPDNRDEVVDHDFAGKPITRGMVDAFARPVASVAKEAEKEQQAAKAESEREQAHVMPPFAAPASQLDAGVAHGDIVAAYTHWMHDSSQFPHSDDTRHPFEAFSAGVKAGCRGRAQGGNTSKENGSGLATPTTSTVSAPTHDYLSDDDMDAMHDAIDAKFATTSTDQANADTGSAE